MPQIVPDHARQLTPLLPEPAASAGFTSCFVRVATAMKHNPSFSPPIRSISPAAGEIGGCAPPLRTPVCRDKNRCSLRPAAQSAGAREPKWGRVKHADPRARKLRQHENSRSETGDLSPSCTSGSEIFWFYNSRLDCTRKGGGDGRHTIPSTTSAGNSAGPAGRLARAH